MKIQVDLKCPLFFGTGGRQFWVMPIYGKFMNVENWQGNQCNLTASPGKFGVRSGSDLSRPYPQYYDARMKTDGTTQLSNTYKDNTRIHWLRYEVTYDLETAKFSGGWKALDETWTPKGDDTAFNALPHPTFDTEIPTSLSRSVSFKNAYWIGCDANTDVKALLAEKGGISGIGLFFGQTGGNGGINIYNSNTATNKVLVDNIRVSWKAPNAEQFEVCYENDFATRRYRTLSYPATTAANYAPKTETKAEFDYYNDYVVGAFNIYGLAPKPTETAVSASGYDDWRRHYAIDYRSYAGNVGIVETTNDAPGYASKKLAFGSNTCFSLLTHGIGQKMTNGTVVVAADIFLQGEYDKSDGYGDSYTYLDKYRNRVLIGFGSTAAHTANPDTFDSSLAATFGYGKLRTGTSDAYSYQWDALRGTTATPEVFADAVHPEKNRWYRFVLAANMDEKSYDVTVTPLGEEALAFGTAATNEPIYSATGLAFEHDVEDIGTLFFWGYGYADSIGLVKYRNKRAMVDNIAIDWLHNDASNRVYTNTFDTRQRFIQEDQAEAKPTAYLAYEYNVDDGPDHWMRRSGVGSDYVHEVATVRDDGGNQYVSLGADQSSGRCAIYTHALGGIVTNHHFRFSVDMRPPTYALSGGARQVVVLSGRSLEQSQVYAWASYAADDMLKFSFKSTATRTNGGRYETFYPEVCIRGDSAGNGKWITSASQVDPTHWYRFLVKGDCDNDKLAVKVYDMGTTHPTPEMRPTEDDVIMSIADAQAIKPLSNGISALRLSANDLSYSPEVGSGMDPAHFKVDNLKFAEYEPNGMLLIIK